MRTYLLIGLMSGTSMDGLDICLSSYSVSENLNWNYNIIHTKTVHYPSELLEKIKLSFHYTARNLLILDKELGQFYADSINDFIQENALKVGEIDAIASHGHTIFHEPESGFTYQIGCGDTIAYKTGIKVINDFRQKDVVAGGQGAPLVPIGDKLLFADLADAFLNIGGFCNISFHREKTEAYDICPGNLPLNLIVEEIGLAFDKNGDIASNGEVNAKAFDRLNSLQYYHKKSPKSLGNEWLTEQFIPIVNEIPEVNDRLRTIVEHIANQIGSILSSYDFKKVLVTGGGTKNTFLISRISNYYKGKIIIPDELLIDFKEALIFGFLGALYLDGQTNSLMSVTGAKKDLTIGVLHLP